MQYSGMLTHPNSIWTAKFTVSEYLKRLTQTVWTGFHERMLDFIRIFLVVTFFAVVIATLTECHTFTQYWQVVPDPGPRCRTGYAQLLVMGSCDIVTDILLIAFPISIVVRSKMPFGRKISISALFALSLILIAITAYRMSAIINSRGRQQLRTLWASLEILAAAAVSNAVILGSFLRDRGVKKQKYKSQANDTARSASVNEGQSNLVKTMTRRHWGADSDEDLFSTLRGRLDSVVEDTSGMTPAPPAEIVHLAPYRDQELRELGRRSGSLSGGHPLAHQPIENPEDQQFFDVGGILASPKPSSSTGNLISHNSRTNLCPSSAASPASNPLTTSAFDFADVGGLLSRKDEYSDTIADIKLSPLQPAKRRESFLSPYTPQRKSSITASSTKSTDSRKSNPNDDDVSPRTSRAGGLGITSKPDSDESESKSPSIISPASSTSNTNAGAPEPDHDLGYITTFSTIDQSPSPPAVDTRAAVPAPSPPAQLDDDPFDSSAAMRGLLAKIKEATEARNRPVAKTDAGAARPDPGRERNGNATENDQVDDPLMFGGREKRGAGVG